MTVSVPATGLAGASHFFSANGAFDPDITGVGHQVMGFDQMMSFYEQYTVVFATATATCIGEENMRAALYLSPDTTSITDPIRLMENGLITTCVHAGTVTQVGTRPKPLTLACDVRKYFGRRTQQELLDDNSLVGTAAANPTEQVYFAVTAWCGHNLPAIAKNLYFDILIEYDVVYWEPKKQSVSVSRPLPSGMPTFYPALKVAAAEGKRK